MFVPTPAQLAGDWADRQVDFGGYVYSQYFDRHATNFVRFLPRRPPTAANYDGGERCLCPSCKSEGWYAGSPLCKFWRATCWECHGVGAVAVAGPRRSSKVSTIVLVDRLVLYLDMPGRSRVYAVFERRTGTRAWRQISGQLSELELNAWTAVGRRPRRRGAMEAPFRAWFNAHRGSDRPLARSVVSGRPQSGGTRSRSAGLPATQGSQKENRKWGMTTRYSTATRRTRRGSR
jgi:hypothetical protein